MEQVRLRKCPFCGSEAEFRRVTEWTPESWEARCKVCGCANSPDFPTKTEAAKWWNERPLESKASQNEIARLTAELAAANERVRELERELAEANRHSAALRKECDTCYLRTRAEVAERELAAVRHEAGRMRHMLKLIRADFKEEYYIYQQEQARREQEDRNAEN